MNNVQKKIFTIFVKMDKSQLARKLIEEGFFWSYQINNVIAIPDNLLIEKTLRWADVPEILSLFEIFDFKKIKKVWETTLIPDKRIYPHNYYLAKIFFNIDDAKNYIHSLMNKNNRYERIKKFASGNGNSPQEIK